MFQEVRPLQIDMNQLLNVQLSTSYLITIILLFLVCWSNNLTFHILVSCRKIRTHYGPSTLLHPYLKQSYISKVINQGSYITFPKLQIVQKQKAQKL